MASTIVPTIFSEARRASCWKRAQHLQRSHKEPARFLWSHMIDDMVERLSFLRFDPQSSLVPWESGVEMDDLLCRADGEVSRRAWIDFDAPFAQEEFDFIGLVGQLDAVNDLPGALIHIRSALKPDGLAIVSFIGGQSLPTLRQAMLAADGERPAARIHPMVDPRAAPQLLQRAGWRDPVVDTHVLKVRYPSLDQLVHDLRDHGMTSALADAGPPIGKAALASARTAFLEHADSDGKVTERFEIITLTGRR